MAEVINFPRKAVAYQPNGPALIEGLRNAQARADVDKSEYAVTVEQLQKTLAVTVDNLIESHDIHQAREMCESARHMVVSSTGRCQLAHTVHFVRAIQAMEKACGAAVAEQAITALLAKINDRIGSG